MTIRPPMRRVISALLGFHLCAIAHAGLVSYLPAKLNHALGMVFAPYLNGLFLAHQFAFYGPDPGDAQVMNAKSFLKDGTTEERWFHQPEDYDSMLLFIRFQNLSAALAGPPTFSTALAHSYAQFLCRENPRRQAVQISRVLHRPRTLLEMRQDKNPNALDTFAQPFVMGKWPCRG